MNYRDRKMSRTEISKNSNKKSSVKKEAFMKTKNVKKHIYNVLIKYILYEKNNKMRILININSNIDLIN